MATALSAVVLLGDAPPPVLGTLLSDFWTSTEDDEIAKMLNKEIASCESSTYDQSPQRAGHVTIFPLGKNF